MWAHFLPVRLQAIMNLLLMFKLGKTLSKNTRADGCSCTTMSAGFASYEAASALIKRLSCFMLGTRHTVHPSNSQMPGCNCDSPLEKHNYVQTGRVDRTTVQMQNSQQMHQVLGWGALCDDTPTFCVWLDTEKAYHKNCTEMRAVQLALYCF